MMHGDPVASRTRGGRRLLFRNAIAIAMLVGCDRSSSIPGPGLPNGPVGGITVMTWNIYLGGELGPVLAAAPADLPAAVAQVFAQVQATNFAARAGRVATEIAATRPDLIALQEMELYRRQTPGDAISGGTIPATTPVIDFQQVLLDSLAARGLTYVPAATRTGLDLEVPMLTGSGPSGPTYDDLRFTDRDGILARGDVATSHAMAADFIAQALVTVGGVPIRIPRGWASVQVSVAGTPVRVVDTHLEVQAGASVQEAQAQELIDLLAADPQPILVVGDFNSAANVYQTRSYGLLTAAGYIDAWAQVHPEDSGPTCCQAPDLLNPASLLDQRLDFIFWRAGGSLWRGEFGVPGERIAGGVQVQIVGQQQGDRTASGLWPSDHAGVVASMSGPLLIARP